MENVTASEFLLQNRGVGCPTADAAGFCLQPTKYHIRLCRQVTGYCFVLFFYHLRFSKTADYSFKPVQLVHPKGNSEKWFTAAVWARLVIRVTSWGLVSASEWQQQQLVSYLGQDSALGCCQEPVTFPWSSCITIPISMNATGQDQEGGSPFLSCAHLTRDQCQFRVERTLGWILTLSLKTSWVTVRPQMDPTRSCLGETWHPDNRDAAASFTVQLLCKDGARTHNEHIYHSRTYFLIFMASSLSWRKKSYDL